MGGYPNTFSIQFFTDFSNSKNCFDLSGGKNIFLGAKVPQKWSSFFKKIHCIFVTLGGGGWLGQTGCNKCYIFFFLFEGLPLIDTTEHVQNVLRYFNLSFNNSVCYNCFLLCRTTLQRQILSKIISSSLIMSSYKRPISWFKNYKLNGWKIFQFWHECVMLSRTDLRDTEMDV